MTAPLQVATTRVEQTMLRLKRGTFLVAALLAGACVDSTLGVDATSPPSTTLGSIVVEPRVSVLAVGGTQQLAVNATSLTGEAVTSFDSVLFRLNAPTDSVRATLSSTGLLTGRSATTSAVLVNVFAFKSGVARGDQALVQVTAFAVPGVELSIQPVSPDSAMQAVGVLKRIVPSLRNPSTGQSVENPVMRYRINAADRAKANVYLPILTTPGPNGVRVEGIDRFVPGFPLFPNLNQILGREIDAAVWIFGEVTAYGTALRDSVLYIFTAPYFLQYWFPSQTLGNIFPVARGSTVAVSRGATIEFMNQNSQGHELLDVTFDDPAAATAASPPSTDGGSTGNIVALGTPFLRSTRRFMTPDTVRWVARARSTSNAPFFGADSGIIIVK